ncbi:hypothetical protein A3E06_02590 [Candidatus Giovannonibacteria bacterium RIFCSPHIGHO2_12_FULL_44_42]|nr:MAG: hypothetical protein UW28_C0019G0024 [Parcubacteria group bacterium GW2011_GWA2_44_13]OGF71935.1 MAG: hypothetical protein A3E06_02590 [Candidatus Giovannonibacteria bacterium RIFCSPHIGHO2_12_FULL_44_42]OGF89717.1 MAG: hypothetical protein A3I94_00110 [Candidatus Giovannonibacteria bacterium RIFCSPLOWO2_02_FULL_43_54]
MFYRNLLGMVIVLSLVAGCNPEDKQEASKIELGREIGLNYELHSGYLVDVVVKNADILKSKYVELKYGDVCQVVSNGSYGLPLGFYRDEVLVVYTAAYNKDFESEAYQRQRNRYGINLCTTGTLFFVGKAQFAKLVEANDLAVKARTDKELKAALERLAIKEILTVAKEKGFLKATSKK